MTDLVKWALYRVNEKNQALRIDKGELVVCANIVSNLKMAARFVRIKNLKAVPLYADEVEMIAEAAKCH